MRFCLLKSLVVSPGFFPLRTSVSSVDDAPQTPVVSPGFFPIHPPRMVLLKHRYSVLVSLLCIPLCPLRLVLLKSIDQRSGIHCGGSISVGVDLRKLGAKEKDLCGVVGPH